MAGLLARSHAVSSFRARRRKVRGDRAVKASADGGDQPALGPEDVLATLPHRQPFLLVDRVEELEPGQRAVATKAVTFNEGYFEGHFPGRPIMPGVLQVEALAQTAGVAMLAEGSGIEAGGQFFFGGVDKCRFKKPVLPGDCLRLEATLEKASQRWGFAKFSVSASARGESACEAEITLAFSQ